MYRKQLVKNLWRISLLLMVIVLLPLTALADNENNQAMGSFKVDLPKNMNNKPNGYVPIDQVAETLGSKLEWKLDGKQVTGSFSNMYFSSDKFLISNGHLYLPINIFLSDFGIHIVIKGNNYFIYRNFQSYKDLELVINTDQLNYQRNDQMAVSILLHNKSNHDIDLQYASSQKYDLVLTRYNREIWRLSDGQGFLTYINQLNLKGNEYKLYTALIDPSQNSHLYYGRYQLYAEIRTANGGVIKSNEIEIKID